MISKDIMCPYFREPCLREGCTAFLAMADMDFDGEVINTYSYCSALRVNLPEGANNA